MTTGSLLWLPGQTTADQATALARTAQCEIARLRGYARLGRHEDALRALDAALRALDALDRFGGAYATTCSATLRADLDRLTGGAA